MDKGIIEKKEGTKGKAILSPERMINYTLTLPAEAFARFNEAKASGLINDGDTTFDERVYECINRSFIRGYGVQIVIQPIAAEKKDETREMVRETVEKVLAEKLSISDFYASTEARERDTGSKAEGDENG